MSSTNHDVRNPPELLGKEATGSPDLAHHAAHDVTHVAAVNRLYPSYNKHLGLES